MAHRVNKINDELKRVISSLVRTLKDPRVTEAPMLSVCAVEAGSDLTFAKVYISVMGTEEQTTQAITGLNAAGGYIRHELYKALKLRAIPQLKFIPDKSIEYGAHINAVLKGLGDLN